MDKLDMVLIMSVNPGFGGQSFIPEALKKIAEVRRRIDESGRDILLEVDGGIKIDNIAAAAAPAPTPSWPVRPSSASRTTRPSSTPCAPNWPRSIASPCQTQRGSRAYEADQHQGRHHRPRRHHARHGRDFHVAINRMREELGLTPLSQETIVNLVGKGRKPDPPRAGRGLRRDEAAQHFQQALDAYTEHYLAINGDYRSTRAWSKACKPARQGPAPGLRDQQAAAFAVPLLQKKGCAISSRWSTAATPSRRRSPTPCPAEGLRGFRPGTGTGRGHRRLQQRRPGRPRGRLPC
jgi:hypothetical protein